ncbi:class I SAM-dependent methyltransferase [Lutimonas halocynthiae]|uniref:class I SAM-dependent methyltransferase n=1 Tax=Lutimonas halocynthiae TaxID=1446477 RepID=UPI0025B55A6A|nr:class I SAM-dependent methyltransferase [Lutimonas halocynthiae]MDN3643276.1 class I SAM-dependent methyltransferase [Lutimonas halocynthiae]
MTKKYYKTKESVEEYISLAKDVNGAELIEKLKDFLPSESSLLEIGTGPGTDWNILKDDYEVVGSDNSPEFLKHLNANHPNGTFLELDAITLKTNQNFDGIYSNKVMHHLKDSELVEAVKRQNDVLNPHGIICHSFWRGEGSEIFKGLFVNYHTEQSLKHFFAEQFEILMIEFYDEFEEADSLLLIAKKREVSEIKY